MDLCGGHEGGGGGGDEEIPMPISSAYGSGPYGLMHEELQHHHHHHHHHSNGPLPLSSANPEEPNHHHLHHHHSIINCANKKPSSAGVVAVKYRECLKNHAAAIGGNATDGCGEFMPNGEEGTLEALKCSACGCHRNFHRKEGVGGGHKGLLITAAGHHHHHHLIMPLSSQSASDEMAATNQRMPLPPPPASATVAANSKKRFRTKFTAEQKEKMLGFAEKVGWRLPRQQEEAVQRFCQEVGVKRRGSRCGCTTTSTTSKRHRRSINSTSYY